MLVGEYQNFCMKGLKEGNDLTTFALGLGGETGEVLDILKKARRDETPYDKEHLIEELGDVCWYVANICSSIGVTMDEMLNKNIKKLERRYNL